VRTVFAAAYWIFAILLMPPLWVVAMLIHVVAWPFDRRRVALHLFGGFWGGLYVWLNPIWRCRYAGREHLPWRGAAVIVANHASLVDILVLYALLRPFKWVSKAELGRVPFVGWMLWLNDYVLVRRGDRDSIRRMLDHCHRHLAAGSPLLLFPEGTRTRDGRLQAFKEGGFKLAIDHRVPVIPVAVRGTYDALPKTGIVFGRMDCRVEVLPPLDPAAFASAAELRDAARAAIAAALGEAPAAAGAAAAPPGAPAIA
jgi:1-acyl-sn-glycerol-3-phosphate acyltransferase